MGFPCLIQFAQIHPEFRIPELLSCAELYQIPIGLPADLDITRPFMVVDLEGDRQAHLLAERCILIKQATTLDIPSTH